MGRIVQLSKQLSSEESKEARELAKGRSATERGSKTLGKECAWNVLETADWPIGREK